MKAGRAYVEIVVTTRKRRRWIYALAVDLLILLATLLAVAAIAEAVLAQQTCQIDPTTGQVVCDQGASWPEPRIVRILHTDPPYMGFLTGAVVSIDGRGYVLTCAHELERNGERCVVEFADGMRCGGQVIGIDRGNDCALVAIGAQRRLVGFTLAEREPAPHEEVQFVGFAYGRFYRVRRTYLQLQKYIGNSSAHTQSSRGESGGPVITRDGQIVGVISAGDKVETMCCRLPAIRTMLDRVFPNRPGRVIPRADGWQPNDPRPSLGPQPPQPSTPLAPVAPVSPATPSTFAPLPPIVAQPTETPTVPALEIPPLVAPPATAPPKWQPDSSAPGSIALPAIVDVLMRVGLGATGAGLAAWPIYWLGKRAGQRLLRRAPTAPAPSGHRPQGGQPPVDDDRFVDIRRPATARPHLRVVTTDAPPPPQQVVTRTEFAPYEVDTFAAADAQALREYVRKYPGSVATIEGFKGMREQFLSAMQTR